MNSELILAVWPASFDSLPWQLFAWILLQCFVFENLKGRKEAGQATGRKFSFLHAGLLFRKARSRLIPLIWHYSLLIKPEMRTWQEFCMQWTPVVHSCKVFWCAEYHHSFCFLFQAIFFFRTSSSGGSGSSIGRKYHRDRQTEREKLSRDSLLVVVRERHLFQHHGAQPIHCEFSFLLFSDESAIRTLAQQFVWEW